MNHNAEKLVEHFLDVLPNRNFEFLGYDCMLFTGFFMPLCGAGILNSNDKHMGKALPPPQPRERSSH